MAGIAFRAIVVMLCVCSLAWAQDFRATLTGQITDPSRAPVPGALIKAVKEGTNEAKETKTNAEGVYTLPYLDPGTYIVEIAAPGFNTVRRTIVLRVADKLNLSVPLDLGTVVQEVTVVGQQELIQTTTGSRGLNFDPIKVQEYPLNGRQSYMLLRLTPGVLFTQEQFGSSGFSGTRAWDVNSNYTMNGGRTGTNQFLMNGAPISTDGTWQIAPNVEAIQEFKVMVNTYDAEYGRSGGGHVNTTIKSGTNDLHGSVFDFWRNTIFDANNTQNNRQGAGRGKRNQHQFGGTVGFPIRKNKDFLFYSFEGWREIVPFPVVSNTIPAAMRTGGGFTQFNQRIYDPLTSRLCTPGVDAPTCLAGGLFIRSPFPNNEIPERRISPIGKRIVDLYPLPNQVGNSTLTQNFFATGSVGRYRYEQHMGRYDKVIGDKNRVYGLAYFQDGSEFRNQNGFAPPAQTGNMPGTFRTQHGVVIDWTRVLSPTIVLDVRASHTRFWQNFPDVSDRDFTWDKLGIRTIPTPPTASGRFSPRIAPDDYNVILGGRILNWSSRDQIEFTPSISMTRGRHGLKFGYQWALLSPGVRNEDRPNGEFNFSRFWTQQYSGRGQGALDGSPVAAMLLGLPTGGGIDFNDTFLRREPYMAWFIHDDWKVSTHLTLNLGLRYDVQFPFTEIHNRVNAGFAFDAKNPLSDQVLARWRQLKAEWDANPANRNNLYPDVPSELKGGLLFAGVGGQPRRTYDFEWTNIQPRVGFAWQFMKNTVFRGGLGIFHRTATQRNTTTGFSQRTPYQRSLDGDRTPSSGLTGPYSLENPFPDGIIPPTGSSLGLLTNVGRGVSVDGRQRVIPRTYQYSAGFERELPWGMVLEVSYVGNRTYQEPMGINLSEMSNEDFLRAQANPNRYNQPVPNPFFGILPPGSDFGAAPTINLRNLVRRHPLFNGLTYNLNPWGATWYNALQVRWEKRAFSRSAGAITWVLSYTAAKQLERFLRNNQNFEKERPISQLTDFDRPQQFSFSGVWDLPVGKGRRWVNTDNKFLNALVGGWNYNWILFFYSGRATTKPDAVFTCSDYRVKNQTVNQWFNNDRTCYSQRAPFTFREVEQRFGNIRNPDYGPQLEMALAKKIRISERYELEIRGESFNTTNTPILDGPNTGFTDPRFGQLPIQQLNFPRQMQIGLRLKF